MLPLAGWHRPLAWGHHPQIACALLDALHCGAWQRGSLLVATRVVLSLVLC